MSFKFCLYSDIHGQIPQLEAVEAGVEKENPDKIVVIGDLVGLGPEPGEIVQRMIDRPWIDVIVGNVDLWVTRKVWENAKPKSPHQEWMFRMMEMTRERLNKSQLEWLDKRPFSITFSQDLGHDFHVFHGTPYDIGDSDAFPFRLTDDEIAALAVAREDNWFTLVVVCEVVLKGPTHVLIGQIEALGPGIEVLVALEGELIPPEEIGELIAFLITGPKHLSGATLDVTGANYLR